MSDRSESVLIAVTCWPLLVIYTVALCLLTGALWLTEIVEWGNRKPPNLEL